VERRWAAGQSASILAAETRGACSHPDKLVEWWNETKPPESDVFFVVSKGWGILPFN